MPRRENTFRVDYSQFPKQLSHEEIHKFVGKELGLTRENVVLLQPSRRLGCTFVEVNNLELAEAIVRQHDNKHEYVFDGKSYKMRIVMEDGAVEVRLFDLSNEVSNEQIGEFLGDYGDVINIRDLLWDERTAFGGIKTGVRVARMVVKKNIPSLVTIQGEDTAVAYKGQRQTCLHCQEFVHVGIPCVQNKKLLVQKLAADQSYATVAKQPALPPKPVKPNNPPPKLQPSQVHPISTANEPVVKAKEKRTTTAQQKSTMPPPAAKSVGAQPVVLLTPLSTPMTSFVTTCNTDGNDTDSSQTSTSSINSRHQRSRRSPPGKKMRPNDSIKHSRDSGEDIQQ